MTAQKFMEDYMSIVWSLCSPCSQHCRSLQRIRACSSCTEALAWLCVQCGDGEHARIVPHRLHSQRPHSLYGPPPQEPHLAVLRRVWRAAAGVPPHQGASHVSLHLRLHRQGAPLWPCCHSTRDELGLTASSVMSKLPQEK